MGRRRAIMLIPVIFVLFFEICQISGDPLYNITTLTNSTGLYYENLGTINLYNDFWKFLTLLDSNNIYLEYENIRYYHSEINSICSKLSAKSIEIRECSHFLNLVNSTFIDLT